MAFVQRILVVGGNGFVGSTVCKTALAKGMRVTSISSSGEPFRTPKGHIPTWTSEVDWQKGNALRPESYAHLMTGVTAVVHTLGTLFENKEYKQALKNGDLPGLIKNLFRGPPSANPLEQGSEERQSSSYEVMNRDAALRVCETFMASQPPPGLDKPRIFIYISAEDVSRPWVSARYIDSKRRAEVGIDEMLSDHDKFRAVHIRPSLIYHPHLRPAASPLATVFDLSANIHSRIPQNIPTPSGILRTCSALFSGPSSSLQSIANFLTIPPIHVDHVAEAITLAADVERTDIRGVLGVYKMRELLGWAAPSYAH